MGIENTLQERGSRYGDFTDRAILAQKLQDCVREFTKHNSDGMVVCPWDRLSPVKRQALTVIMDKIARILSGDPEYRDNWHDIQGYAKLAEDRCLDGDALAQGVLDLANDPRVMPELLNSVGYVSDKRTA